MNKLLKALLVINSMFASYSAQAAPVTPLPPSTLNDINNKWSGVDTAALQRVIDDGVLINNTTVQANMVNDSTGGRYYGSSSISGTLNGHAVTVYSTNGSPLGQLGQIKVIDAITGGRVTKDTQQVSISGLSSEKVTLEIDGTKILESNQLLNRQDAIDLARTLEIIPTLDVMTSSSLASTSPSSASSQLVYGVLNPNLVSRSHRERRAIMKEKPTNFAMADLKYEQARFTNSNNNGDIKGTTMTMSTEAFGVELGAYIPYDYMNFEGFDAHRTGTMLFAKRNWQLPSSLQLTTLVNFNYMATYVSSTSLTNTFGGGFGTSLSHDNGGDFVPRVSFALQYNQDDYYKANDLIKDNHQLLVKTGGSLGYRLFDNATLQAGVIYTRDVTDYKSGYNKKKDNDYFDVTVGGSYAIGDMWQVNLNYKRILGLETYYSNSVFLGTALDF